RTEENVEIVCQVITDYPRKSITHLSQKANEPLRLQFCQWFINQYNNNDAVFGKVFFTDEAWFYLSGYVKSQNMRLWSADNPQFYIKTTLHSQKN
ncbi:hypothetical protein NQ318_017980, partial [Aromia moschata]